MRFNNYVDKLSILTKLLKRGCFNKSGLKLIFDILSSRFIKDLEEEVMNDDSLIWKEETEPQVEATTDVTPASPQSTNDTRSVSFLGKLSLLISVGFFILLKT